MALKAINRHGEARTTLALADVVRGEAVQSSLQKTKSWIASSWRFPAMRSAVLAITVLSTAANMASAQTVPDGENGRYSMSVVPDGLMRLDTRTGAVSTCTNKGAGWACYAIPDERAALDAEIGRLQTDNDSLRAQLAARPPSPDNKTDEALPKSDPLAPSLPKSADGERKIEIPLPSDKDMERIMGFLESAWKRLVDMAARIQRDTTGRI